MEHTISSKNGVQADNLLTSKTNEVALKLIDILFRQGVIDSATYHQIMQRYG